MLKVIIPQPRSRRDLVGSGACSLARWSAPKRVASCDGLVPKRVPSRAMSSFSISGLESRPDLNGREAVVVGTQGARRKVRVLDTGEIVALKAVNLVPNDAAPASRCLQDPTVVPRHVSACDGCGKAYAKTELKNCARCKTPKYCSQPCQKRHWPEHKLVCKQMARARGEARRGGVGGGCAAMNALRAQDRLFEGKTESAKKLVAKALAADPENLNARLQQALMLCMNDDYDGAIPIMEAALRQGCRSSHGEVEYNLGKAYNHRGRPGDQQRALEHLRCAWAANPRDSSTANMIAACYKAIYSKSRAAADLDEAERWCKRAYALDKDDPRASTDSAVNLATLYLQKNDPAAAIPLLEAALAAKPRDVVAKALLDQARSM